MSGSESASRVAESGSFAEGGFAVDLFAQGVGFGDEFVERSMLGSLESAAVSMVAVSAASTS